MDRGAYRTLEESGGGVWRFSDVNVKREMDESVGDELRLLSKGAAELVNVSAHKKLGQTPNSVDVALFHSRAFTNRSHSGTN